ncbi:hypothetical protein NL676_029169 [Syzygium grande]|nr:hypothetical protein NL676_029169 [Syzygium grande]
MTSELCTVTDARAAVVVFSDTGFHYLFGSSSFENIIFDWVKKQRESCVAKEDFDSLNLNYEAVLHHVRKKLKDISGSGAGCDSEGLNDDNFDSPLKILKACCEALSDLFKEYVSDGLLTSPVNSAFASGSSGNEPMRSVFVGREFNPHSSLNLTENNASVNAGAGGHSGVGVGHYYEVLNDDDANWILSLLAGNGNCDRNGGPTVS